MQKIKNYFIKLYNKYSCLYIPYFKVLLSKFLLFNIAIGLGVIIGILCMCEIKKHPNIELSSNTEIELEEKEYILLPMLPYTDSNDNNYDFSMGSIIISKYQTYNTHLDIIFPTLELNEYVFATKTIASYSTIDIAMQSGQLGYYDDYYLKTYRISINYSVDDWVNKFDRIQRYGYFYDVNNGLNYNTVYNFYNGDTKIASLYFLDNTVIPYFDYNSITNLVFTSNRISSLNVNDLVDSVYQRGYNIGYDNGHNDGYNLGYDNGHNDGYTVGFDIGYENGYSTGYTEGHAIGYDKGVLGDNVFTILADGMNNFLSINILPNFSILNLLSIVVGAIIILGIGMKVFSI